MGGFGEVRGWVRPDVLEMGQVKGRWVRFRLG